MTLPPLDHRFCVAPMMDATDRHCRYFMRLMSRHALLYTEMVTTGAIIHGDREHLLGFDPAEQPVALQLGGSEPADMARCAGLAEALGYREVNINVGCPSDRVQRGRFGACLMAEPELVARCVEAMSARVSIPITVKTRIGIDDRDSYEELLDFVDTVAAAGCETFIVHARKAWLSGLSPRENREIPPLHHDVVFRLKSDRPALRVVLNGGLDSLDACREHLARVDGVMLGREVYRNPFLLTEVDATLFDDPADPPSRHDVARAMIPYIADRLAAGEPINRMTRHMLGLFQGRPGARAWRRRLSENLHRPGVDERLVERVLLEIPEHDLRRRDPAPGRQVA